MKLFDESELRTLLAAYEVCEPGIPLVERTKQLMREELALCTAAVPAWQQRWLLVILASAVLLALSLFYMLSVGTILRMVIPPQYTVFLVHSLYAFTAAEVCLIAGTIMVLFLRQVQPARNRLGRVTA
ncbi:MAG: hypothetical protein ACYC9O_21700 [Candidatus Latescibacterota bacterium]